MANVVLSPVHTKLLKTWTVLAQAATRYTTQSTSAVQLGPTVTIPGGTLGPNGVLKIETWWDAVGTTNTKFVQVKFAGTNLSTVSMAAEISHIATAR